MPGDPTDEEPQSGSEEEAEGPADPQEVDANEPPEEEGPDADEPEAEPETDPDVPPEGSAESAVESGEDAEEDDDAVDTPDLAPRADLTESWASMDDRPEQYQVGEGDKEAYGKDSEESDGDSEEGTAGPEGDRDEGADKDGEEGQHDESDEEPEDGYTQTKVVPDQDDDEDGGESEAGETDKVVTEGEENAEGDEEQAEAEGGEGGAAEDEEESEDDAEDAAGEEEPPEQEGEGEKESSEEEDEGGEAEEEEAPKQEAEREKEPSGKEDGGEEGEVEESPEQEEGEEEETPGEEDEGDDEGSEQVEYHDDTTPIQRKTGPESDQEQPLADHIEEMIKRLAIVVIIAGLVSLLAFPFGEEFINFLWYSVLPSDISQPHVYHPLELVITQLKAASLLGLVLALPVFVYETYAFMRPGLYPHERRYYLAAVPTSLILAFVGLLFGYFLVLPAVMTYFLVYSRDVVDIAFALGQTFNLMLILLGYLALVFQIPLFIMLAIMMGLTTRTWLEDRRLIFWGAFLGISFLFSPDPTGMAPILVAATMIALFEGTLLLLRWTKRGG